MNQTQFISLKNVHTCEQDIIGMNLQFIIKKFGRVEMMKGLVECLSFKNHAPEVWQCPTDADHCVDMLENLINKVSKAQIIE
jgi:hypothetical protein